MKKASINLILTIIISFSCTSIKLISQEIKIGNQVWATKNAVIVTFRNGDPIPLAYTAQEWYQAGVEGKPAWCYYNNDSKNNFSSGKLYNWYAVNDPRGFAPEGWHVPSDAEWTVLTDFLGGEEGTSYKFKSITDWCEYQGKSGNGTNSTGFNGYPGGYRGSNGIDSYFCKAGLWWCSTENDTKTAWSRSMNFIYGDILREEKSKQEGYSVRLIKD